MEFRLISKTPLIILFTLIILGIVAFASVKYYNSVKEEIIVTENISNELNNSELNNTVVSFANASICGNSICDENESQCMCPDDCGTCASDVISCKTLYCNADNQCVNKTVDGCCGNKICESGEYDKCSDCPSCDDKLPCTTDSYDYDKESCTHKLLDNCCGNRKCESEESCSSCFADCTCELTKTLADYPSLFDGKDMVYVVGKDASTEDVILVTNIVTAASLKSGSAEIDSDISVVESQNIIAVGSPCENKIVYQLLKSDLSCDKIVQDGKGLLKLVSTGKNTYALIVSGNKKADKELASEVISDYDNYKLEGKEMLIDLNFITNSLTTTPSTPITVSHPNTGLAFFPKFFLNKNLSDVIIIISDEATMDDKDLASSLKKYMEKQFLVVNPLGDYDIPINLSTEIDDVTKVNAVVIGDPVLNPDANALYNRYDFQAAYPSGTALIKLYNKTMGASVKKTQVLISAIEPKDVRRAGQVITHPGDYPLYGDEVKITTDADTGDIKLFAVS